MRFVIACGGTGGHFYPGYVLGKELRGRGHEVLFVLRSGDPAGNRLEAEDLPFAELDLRGLPRRPTPALLAFPFRLLSATARAWRIFRDYRPDAAAGMGGYLTFPVAAAARLRRVPLVLHESNAILGLANAVCAPWARTLALGLPLADPPANARLTGTPVRTLPAPAVSPKEARLRLGLAPDLPTILVFGGSQGAASINRILPRAVLRLVGSGKLELQVLHLTGERGAGEAASAYASAGERLRRRVAAYAEDMSDYYAAADLVVSRSGAGTVAELAALKKPALLLPYPHAAAGHQEANAKVLSDAGAALLRKDAEVTPESLEADLRGLLNPDVLRRMSEAYANAAVPDPAAAASALADLLIDGASSYC